MTVLQVYAFFILPLIILGMGLAAYWFLGNETPEAK